MKRTSKLLSYCLFALAITLISCSAEDGQDGIAGRDGINGVDGTDGVDGAPGQDGGAGAIDLGWASVQIEPQTDTAGEVLPTIFFGPIFDELTAEELSSLALFAYLRFPDNRDVNFAIPANVIMGADEMSAVAYDISFFGIVENQLLFLVERTDGAPITEDAVFPAFEFKTILIPSSPIQQQKGIQLNKFLK